MSEAKREEVLSLLEEDFSKQNHNTVHYYYEEVVDTTDTEMVGKLEAYFEKHKDQFLPNNSEAPEGDGPVVPEDTQTGDAVQVSLGEPPSELEKLRAENEELRVGQPSAEDKEELEALRAENAALRNQNKSDFGNDFDLSEKERAMLAPIKINCEKTGTHPLVAVESKLNYLKRRRCSLQDEATRAHNKDSGLEAPKVVTYLEDIKTLESIVNKAKKA